jgi:hypothetical protein
MTRKATPKSAHKAARKPVETTSKTKGKAAGKQLADQRTEERVKQYRAILNRIEANGVSDERGGFVLRFNPTEGVETRALLPCRTGPFVFKIDGRKIRSKSATICDGFNAADTAYREPDSPEYGAENFLRLTYHALQAYDSAILAGRSEAEFRVSTEAMRHLRRAARVVWFPNPSEKLTKKEIVQTLYDHADRTAYRLFNDRLKPESPEHIRHVIAGRQTLIVCCDDDLQLLALTANQ